MIEFKTDPKREKFGREQEIDSHHSYFTGILVPARKSDGTFAAVDIEELDRESLIHWLTDDTEVPSRRSVSTCLHLMGHKMLDPSETL